MVPCTLKLSSPEHNPGDEIDEDLTADDLMSFQWQVACGMVRFQIFSFNLLSRNISLFLNKIFICVCLSYCFCLVFLVCFFLSLFFFWFYFFCFIFFFKSQFKVSLN